LRNAKDLTKEKREELIIATNDKALSAKHLNLMSFMQSFVSLLLNEINYLEFETLVDELALNLDTFTSFNYKTLIKT
jgi:hypothetical protein